MPVKPEGLLGDTKTGNVFHHPVKDKIWISTLISIFYIINQLSIRFLIAHITAHFHVI